ncbi:MAG: DUF1080 domain-containing protein [Planctomycetota bacterium]|nr:DUF1080 domain-containing protein [Planctomycetota bacterium]
MSTKLPALLLAALLFVLPACDKREDKKETAPDNPPATPPKAGAEKPGKAAADEPPWISLFDGKTLKNWKQSGFAGEAKARVEDGCILLPPGATLTGITYTGKDLPTMNYEIELEAKRVDGSDFFCGLTFPVDKSSATLVLGGWGGSLVGISSLDGNDAANNETTKMVTFEDKRWYHIRVCILKEKLEAWIDDDKVVDADTKDRKIDVRIDIEECKPCGLATYQTLGAIRNIRARKLWKE